MCATSLLVDTNATISKLHKGARCERGSEENGRSCQTQLGDVMTMRSESTFKTIEVTFEQNEEFDKMTACDPKTETIVTFCCYCPSKKRPAGTKSIIENEME